MCVRASDCIHFNESHSVTDIAGICEICVLSFSSYYTDLNCLKIKCTMGLKREITFCAFDIFLDIKIFFLIWKIFFSNLFLSTFFHVNRNEQRNFCVSLQWMNKKNTQNVRMFINCFLPLHHDITYGFFVWLFTKSFYFQ